VALGRRVANRHYGMDTANVSRAVMAIVHAAGLVGLIVSIATLA
jgi:hypothetical protein